jgi:putative transposase
VHARVRKIIKTRGHFPTDEAATKLIWLALRHITADWSKPVHHWKAAMNPDLQRSALASSVSSLTSSEGPLTPEKLLDLQRSALASSADH